MLLFKNLNISLFSISLLVSHKRSFGEIAPLYTLLFATYLAYEQIDCLGRSSSDYLKHLKLAEDETVDIGGQLLMRHLRNVSGDQDQLLSWPSNLTVDVLKQLQPLLPPNLAKIVHIALFDDANLWLSLSNRYHFVVVAAAVDCDDDVRCHLIDGVVLSCSSLKRMIVMMKIVVTAADFSCYHQSHLVLWNQFLENDLKF